MSNYSVSNKRGSGEVGLFVLVVLALVFIGSLFWIYPNYRVWSSGKTGEAQLRQAESNRQITTLEAKAKQESAKSLAEAAIIEANGIAEANKIIGSSLEDNPRYLQYLWIQSLTTGGNDVIYIPTEANIPILEANRLKIVGDAEPEEAPVTPRQDSRTEIDLLPSLSGQNEPMVLPERKED